MNTLFVLKAIGFVFLGIGLFLLATYVVMRLWNWLVPTLFNGPRLRFVQALGLFFLTRLLVGFGGGFGGRGGPYGYDRHNGGWRHEWRQPNDRQPQQRLKPNVPIPAPNRPNE